MLRSAQVAGSRTIVAAFVIVVSIAAVPAWASNGDGTFDIRETGIEVHDQTRCDWDGNGSYSACNGTPVRDWSNALSTLDLHLFTGGTSNDDIEIVLGNAESACNTSNNLDGCARTYWDGDEYYCVITMDDDRSWNEGWWNQVARHELGHCLDLNHRFVEGDIMDNPFDLSDLITSHDVGEVNCMVYDWQGNSTAC